jgi:DNA polymerase III epsilon subunit-like protein
MYLFFDTETAGLPRSWKAPYTNFDNWPRLVQIAWIQYDENGNELNNESFIIKPEGFTIPAKVAEIHGITTQRALAEGVALKPVLTLFAEKIKASKVVVAHNISFDENIVGAEFVRNQVEFDLFSKKRFCTMRSTTAFCAIPGSFGYKWPTLAELHYAVFEREFDDAHNAKADIEATARCFWELVKRGILKA